jgi:tetratricopeptide (TPR) repeat protein
MTAENISNWMDNPSLLTEFTLEELSVAVSQYPYFQPIRFLYLKNLYLTRSEIFIEELEKTAIFVSDRRKLFYYLAVVEGLWNDVFEYYAQQKSEFEKVEATDTISLIDSFLLDYAPEMLHEKPQRPTHHAAKIAIATQDYASLLDEEGSVLSSAADLKEIVKLKHHDLIDEFISYAGDGEAMRQQLTAAINASETNDNWLEEEMDVLNDEDLLTESLAKIYIKQKRYYKAIEIIRKLSLKYPEKSIYFADQIRFLEKLITNIKKE